MLRFVSFCTLSNKPTQIKTFLNCSISKNNYFTKFRREKIVINSQRNSHNFSSNTVNWTTKVKQNIYTKSKIVCFVLAGVLGVKYFVTSSSCEEVKRNSKVIGQKITLQEAIEKGRDLALRIKDETGSPGLIVAVSCDGKQVWAEGMGFADVENRVPCTPESVMRIASISKSITMTAVARLWESGKLDLDAPIQQYVPDFPEKTVNGEKVAITTRHLVSHLAGIRNYDKTYMDKKSKAEKTSKKENEKKAVGGENEEKSPVDFSEFYIKDYYQTVKDGLKLFKDDSLVHKPGSNFLYTTHGWTLVSAVVEGAAKKSFTVVMEMLFKDLGMENTYLDLNDILIYHRSRNYIKDKNGRLRNAPYVDNSYKWAGGGFLSTVEDLVKFGNAMLYSFQQTPKTSGQSKSRSGNLGRKSATDVKSQMKTNAPDNKGQDPVQSGFSSGHLTGTPTATVKPKERTSVDKVRNNRDTRDDNLPGYLKAETMRALWSPVNKTVCSWDKSGKYGMGWAVIPEKHEQGECLHQRYYVSHTGGAVGASSVLLVLPDKAWQEREDSRAPKGVVVAVVVNMISIGLNTTALKIAKIFEEVNLEQAESETQ
ncbi:serine beta-lactamase-like protein LACTB, mitochondrial [Gigantopelta aegis]|uniref:serine beta-lactamase-like protein LACTB, mitochondrial n=1 Tax=Gigantopelta aegis TaxID=1735272 RepID=UPI001B8897B5|nr:serine beta-lactamase-like protein LACTB, mitochondrial [Gigantopelta aegis]